MTRRADIELESAAPTTAVVGAGVIGSAVSGRPLAAKRAVVVWNRTAGRTRELVDAGARAAASPQAAVTAGGSTLVTLKDHLAVHEAFDQLDGDLSGRTIVVLCAGSPADAQQACERVEQLGAHDIDAGVQPSPDDIGTDRATTLCSGSSVTFERHRHTLGLSSTPRVVGTSPQAAALWDLALFGLWYDAHFGLLRALETVGAAGIDLDDVVETAAIQLGHVVEAAPTTAAELRDADHPRGPADLEEHLVVVRRLIEMRTRSQLGDGGLPHIERVIDALMRQGRGHQGLTATVANVTR